MSRLTVVVTGTTRVAFTALVLALLPAAPAPARPAAGSGAPAAAGLVWIPAGHYEPLYKRPPRDSLAAGAGTPAPTRIEVPGFWMAPHAVTNAQFLAFVGGHPQWRRSRAGRLFVDENYLRHWRGDLELGEDAPPESPVTNVSWFAARAYCAAHGHALPSVDQWEYVAAASERRRDATRDPAFQARLRAWYSRPTPKRLAPVGSTFRDVYGLWDLHGLVWEWTADFGSALVNGESRGDASLDRTLYCGSGAANAADFRDYAAFMRYAFRSSLSARYCVASLGFREAAAAPQRAPGAARTRS